MKRAALAPDSSLPSLDSVIPAWPGELVRVDGSDVFVRRTPATGPDAEPALYVHGLGGSSLNWTDLSYLLADRLDGEAIDLPGFGRSGPAPRYGLPDLADRVVRWIEHSDRGPVHLFGNSLGGAISVRVAARRPDLVRTLTLVSPALPFLDPRRSVQSRLVPLAFLPGARMVAARRLATLTPEELARQVFAACFAQPDLIPPERVAEAIDEVRRRYDLPWYVDAYLRTLRGLIASFLHSFVGGPASMWRLAARITAPTLVVTGVMDRLVDVRVAPAVARTVPDSRLLMLDRVGHVAQMERPRMVARAVAGMLDEVSGRAPAPVLPPEPVVPGMADGPRWPRRQADRLVAGATEGVPV
jgi:pimeloyl-ACP methyl ester carboxylesterase